MRIMNATRMFDTYADRAKAATCPVCRAISMLGMMCAAAVGNGGFFAFVGQGYGGDWPDPREIADQNPRNSCVAPRRLRG
jgi:hypothetical protein